MGLINVYVVDIDDQIIPRWLEIMGMLGVESEITPFSFENEDGHVGFKINLYGHEYEELNGKDLISSIDIFKKEFDLQNKIESLQKKTIFQRLFNKTTETAYYSNHEIDSRLSNCKWILTFKSSTHNTLSYRLAFLSSAVISQLTNGVFHCPSDKKWIYNDNEAILEYALKKSLEHEKLLEPSDWQVHIMPRNND
jgi:hypothetical protein